MSKKNKRKKKYKLRFLLKKFKIKTKFKFIKSSKKRFVKKRFVKKKFVKKKFVKKKIYKKFYKRKVKLTKLSIRNRLNLKKKVKKKLFFSRKFFQKKFSSLNSLKNNFLKFKKNLLYVNFFIQFKLIKLVESLLKNKKIKKYNIKINKFLSFWINYKKALKYKQVLNNLKNFKKSLKKTFFTKCFLKKRFKKSYKLKLTVRRLKKYFKKKKLRKSKYFDKVGLEIINTLKTKIKFQQNFLETFKYSKVFFKYTGSNIFATITTKLGNVLYSYSSGFFKGLCTRKEKTTIFVSKQLGELISMRLYRLNAKEVFFVPLINHKRSRTLIKYMIYGFRLTHSFKIGTIEVKLNVMRNGVRLRKVPRK